MKAILLILLLPVLPAVGQSRLDSKIAEAVARLECTEPDELHPVSLNAQLVVEKDSLAIIVKSRLAPGWHIYDYVPPSLPYIAMDPVLQLPEGVLPVGDWKKSESAPSAMDPGVLIYEKEAVLIHKAVKRAGAKAGTVKAGLYYQTCNLRQCLPPEETTFVLKY